MTEMESILTKLVAVVESTAKETSELLTDYSTRMTRPYIGELRQRASALQLATRDLRTTFDKAHSKQDS